ncbi:MAG: C2 family cysteine protease [Candidatus Gastranaerophilaceae bacterium]
MSDIFENVQQCNVIRNSRWFYDSEYSPKLEKVSNSVFENQPSLIETGCEISISNEIPLDSLNNNKRSKDAPKINSHIEDFRQGFGTGDCWLLASLKSISMAKGGDKVIKNMISQDNYGNVTVKLPGGKEGLKEINISVDEFKSTYGLASLDDDVKVVEMAIRKYRKLALISDLKKEDANYNLIENRISKGDGGNPMEAMELMTGNLPSEITPFYNSPSYGEKGEMFDIEKVKENFAQVSANPTVLSIVNESFTGDRRTVNIDGVDLNMNHAYSVIEVKNDKIYLRNPHRSATKLEVPLKHFMEFVASDENVKVYMEQVSLK